jgi:putative effector of murein hydrolase LrgA (UPF0299 family)
MWWAVAAVAVLGFVLDMLIMAWLGKRMMRWLNNHKVLGK